MGFPVTLCMPSNVSEERKRYLSGIRRRNGLDQSRRRLRWSDPQGARDDRSRARPLLLRRPVLERRELARALPHYRQRDLGADRGPGDALCRRPRHQRHLHGHNAPFEGTEPEDPVHLHAAGLAVQRAGRVEAHGDGNRPQDLRPQPRRPEHRDGDRARLCDGEVSGTQPGRAGGCLRRRRNGRCACRSPKRKQPSAARQSSSPFCATAPTNI